jgi:hypothetical protein
LDYQKPRDWLTGESERESGNAGIVSYLGMLISLIEGRRVSWKGSGFGAKIVDFP